MNAPATFGTVLLLILAAACPAQVPDFQIGVDSATLISGGESTPVAPQKGAFGPGSDGAVLVGETFFRRQLQFPCAGVPAGDYHLGLPVLPGGYLALSEHLYPRIHLYHNDRRVAWTSHTEPTCPENAADPTAWQAELRCDQAIRIAPGDTLRVVWVSDGAHVVVGPLRLYRDAPAPGIISLETPDRGKPRTFWLAARWEETTREGDNARQTCLLYNPGSRARTFHLEATARDYQRRDLRTWRQSITLERGEKQTRVFEFALNSADRASLSVVATAPGVFPAVRLVKFFVADRETGPRPSASLNGPWQMCFVPGVEPGEAPPNDADWKDITVPSLQPNSSAHCAWYRKVFDAPEHLRGERVILKCGQVLSEAWIILNGQTVGHERYGSQPFEIDLTAAFLPGERNELLVGVRDWLAYSPKNRDRLAAGEEPIFKTNMTDPVGYPGAGKIGLGRNVALEARPGVSVDGLHVITSVREGRLTVEYQVKNATAEPRTVTLRPVVLEAGDPVKSLPEATLEIPSGETATTTISAPWSDAKLWWPGDPHLYILQTDLAPDQGAADRHIQRFGFREMWIDGIHFVLNGTRIKIRSAWASGACGMSRAEAYSDPARRLEAIWDWQTECVENLDHQLTRTHNIAGVDEACEIADEVGLMVKIEEADFAQQNFTFDQGFWESALQHGLRVMDTYFNHASVVMWSAGNENMWGWIYQGEAAKTLGNRWQIRIAQAMRDFDTMKRPIEWEADGDLMGAWDYHALHYPAELSGHPDVPNGAWWGPLDGKTVVPYSMGPITLGEKPLTVGEAFWPATLSMPYGQSVVLGDDAYLGGSYWYRGWMEASRYFVNGFRDAEFALIDIYNPLNMIKPQTVILKQEARSFFGGRTVALDANVHNDTLKPAEMTLRWSLSSGERFDGDDITFTIAPAELRRVPLEVRLPYVSRALTARLSLELVADWKTVDRQERQWEIAASQSTVSAPAGAKLTLYDPLGDTAAMLTRLGVSFEKTDELAAPDSGALILGRNALKQPPEGPWREALSGFVAAGGKVLILEQSEAPDFLPTALTLTEKRRSTITFVRAADHPALAGLSDQDLRWWADDQYVSQGNYRKPIRGNVLPLIDAGTLDGMVETPLLEQFEGKGSFLLCQMLLTEKAPLAPPAARLLGNILGYLARPECYRAPGATAVIAAPDSPLRKALDDTRLVYQDMTGAPGDITPDRFQVAILDARTLDDATLAALAEFARSGGRVMIHRATPDQQPALEQALGLRLRFLPVSKQPNDIAYHALRAETGGLMAGISNHDLLWATNRMFADLRHEGGWWSGYNSPPEEWIAEFFCLPADDSREKAVVLARPGVLVQVPVGAGSVLLSQLRLDEPHADVAVTVSRLRALLLTNLGCTLLSDGGTQAARQRRLRQYEFFTVDLAPWANRGLRDDPAAGIVGWTNQGENDMRALPAGRQTFAGIPFQIASPRAAVVLRSPNADNMGLPTDVTGIKIGKRADVLFFLHTAAWMCEKPFKYRVNYADGSSVEIPITGGQQVIDWWADPTRFAESMSRHGLFVAWSGDNPMHKGVILPGYEWTNPQPDKEIRDVDFLSVPDSGGNPVPVLAAITGAVNRTGEGVVTGVLGTAGLKVQLGTQEEEVYYIGVAGIPEEHAFYPQALEAHRQLVMGQKVTVRRDVVTQDPEGRQLAYVYLGRDIYNVNNLLNARIIGEGLGSVGPFWGNSRQQVYLENLGFIAKQRKAGMWAGQ